jgi:spermidine synthase
MGPSLLKISRPFWLVIFSFSGAASLSYQVVWQRVLTQEIGTDSISVTLVIGIFMLGLGLGGFLGGRAVRIKSNLNLLLAALEIFIGIFGYFSINLLRSVNQNLLQESQLELQILVNFLILLLPTIAMGATTPLMIQVYRNVSTGPRNVGTPYSSNVLGAAVGILGFGLIGIGTLGLTKSLHMIAFLDFLIAALLIFAKSDQTSQKNESYHLNDDVDEKKSFLKIYLAVFLIGFAALGLEIVLFRLLTSYFGVTPYVFPIMLFAYLINMAFGTYVGGKISKNVTQRSSFKENPLFKIFVYLPITMLPILFMPKFLYRLGEIYPSYSEIPLYLVLDTSKNGFDSNFVPILTAMLLSSLFLFPISLLSAILPMIVNSIRQKSLEGDIFGKLYFIQTMGNTFGSLFTGFVLYQIFSSSQLVFVFTLISLSAIILITFYLGIFNLRNISPLQLSIAFISMVLILSCNYYADVRYFRAYSEAVSPISVKESIHGATLVYDAYGDETTFRVTSSGRFHVTSLPGKIDSSVRDGVTEPLIYAINGNIKDILFIGLGTATELLNFRKLYPNCKITIVEINPDVVSAFLQFAPKSILKEINSGTLFIGDGRRYLQSNPSLRFDLVHIGVHRASTTGSGNLFSKDFLALVKSHLKSKGLVSFYSYPTVVKAATQVFGNVVVFSKNGSIGHTFATAESAKFITKEFWTRYQIAQSRIGAQLEFSQENVKLENSSVYYPKNRLVQLLKDLDTSSDDKIVTEYYINNRTEIVPGLYKSRSPVDYRVWPPSNLAMNFSPKKIVDKKNHNSEDFVISGQEIARKIQAVEGYPKFGVSENSSAVDVSFGLFPKFNDQISSSRGFQWDFLEIPLASNSIWDVNITCKKTGRGIWGLKFNLITDVDSKVIDYGTRSNDKTTLSFAFKVDSNVERIVASIFFDDANSLFWGKSNLNCYEFSVRAHQF